MPPRNQRGARNRPQDLPTGQPPNPIAYQAVPTSQSMQQGQQQNFYSYNNPLSEEQPKNFSSDIYNHSHIAIELRRISLAQHQQQQQQQQWQQQENIPQFQFNPIQQSIPQQEIDKLGQGWQQVEQQQRDENIRMQPVPEEVSLDGEDQNVPKTSHTLSPRQLQNQELLEQENTTSTLHSRPFRNKRMTRVEQEVARVSEQINRQKQQAKQQVQSHHQQFNQLLGILQEIRTSQRNLDIGIPAGQTPQNPRFTQKYNNQAREGISRIPLNPQRGYAAQRGQSPQQVNNNQNIYPFDNGGNKGYNIPTLNPQQTPQIGDMQPQPPLVPPQEINHNASFAQLNPQSLIVRVAKNVQIKQFNGEDNPSFWLRQFLKHCARTKVIYKDYLGEVRDYLSSRALNWYDKNYNLFGESFENFQDQFLTSFYKDPDVIETQLMSSKQNYDEDLSFYLKRLENISKPANLDKGRIRQAFLMGLRDRDLCNYARQMYLYLHKDRPLEQVVISLQDQENNLKMTKRTTIIGGRGQYTNIGYQQGNQNQNNQFQRIGNPLYNRGASSQNRTNQNRNSGQQQNNRGNSIKQGIGVKANVAKEVQTSSIEQKPQTSLSKEVEEIIEGDDPKEYDSQGYEYQNDQVYVVQEMEPSSNIIPFLIFGTPKQSAKTKSFISIDEIIQKDVQNTEFCIKQQPQGLQEFKNIDQFATSFNNPLFEPQISDVQFQKQNEPDLAQGKGLSEITLNQENFTNQNNEIIDSIFEFSRANQLSIYSIDENTLVIQGIEKNDVKTSPKVKQKKSNKPPTEYELTSNHVLRYINIKINDIDVNALVDTNCTFVVVTLAFIQNHELLEKLVQKYRQLTIVIGTSLSLRDILPRGQISFFEKELSHLLLLTNMMVVAPNSSFSMIVGQSFLNFFRYQIAANGLHLRLSLDNKTIYVPYVADMLYHLGEANLDQYNVLIKESVTFSKGQEELYPKFPIDKRVIIMIDPPWTYYRNKWDIKTPNYQQLNYQQLLQLSIKEIAKEDGILLMWVTSSIFRQAIQLIQAYGYMFKTILFVWVKLDPEGNIQQGKGNYTSPYCEYLVLLTKGYFLKYLQPNIKISQLLQAKNLK